MPPHTAGGDRQKPVAHITIEIGAIFDSIGPKQKS